jgi:hypothetical protein
LCLKNDPSCSEGGSVKSDFGNDLIAVLAWAGSEASCLGGGCRKTRGWSRFANSAGNRVLAYGEDLVIQDLGLLW